MPKEGLLVQVSYRMVDEQTKVREIGALQKAAKFLKAQKCLVVTYDQEETVQLDDSGLELEVIPVYKFLLER